MYVAFYFSHLKKFYPVKAQNYHEYHGAYAEEDINNDKRGDAKQRMLRGGIR